MVPLTALKPAPWNPRTVREARFKALCASLKADPDFLWRRPILAMADGTVYAGNMRLRAAQHLGWTEVPALVEDVPEQLARERALRDNNSSGEWQEDDLAKLVYELGQEGSDLAALAFDDGELRKLLASVGVGGDDAPEAEIDRAEELREKWQTAAGQLWVIPSKSVPGKAHRLLCGDSTRADSVGRLLEGNRAQMLWTDPPYGVEYVGKTKDALTLQGDTAAGLLPLLTAAFTNATAGCEEGAPWYIAHPPGALCLVFGDAIRAAGWRFHQTLIWVKDSMVLGHSDYHFKHEPMYYGFMPGEGRPGRGNHDGTRWRGDHSQVSVFDIPRPKRSEAHPTMKPPALVAACMQNSSGRGDAVLDLFAGSGSTAAAAESIGRVSYSQELDPKYVAVCLERLSQMGLEPRLEAT